MYAITFDTLKYVKKLEQAGVSREQAEALAQIQIETVSEIIIGHLATKHDVSELKQNLATKQDFTEIKDDIKRLELKTMEEIKRLEVKIEQVKYDIIKWVVPLLIGQTAATVALLKFIH